jgi:hypothetical protein
MKQPESDPVVSVILEDLQARLCLPIIFENGSPILGLLEEGKIGAHGVIGGFHCWAYCEKYYEIPSEDQNRRQI